MIQDHYTNPNRIEGAVNALVKDSIFLKGVSLPQDDIRDYTSSKKSEESTEACLTWFRCSHCGISTHVWSWRSRLRTRRFQKNIRETSVNLRG